MAPSARADTFAASVGDGRSRCARAAIGTVSAGAVAGLLAAGADQYAPGVGALLSVPGPWLLAAVMVAWRTSGVRHGSSPSPAVAVAAATGLFLVASVAAYYAGKAELIASVPWPLAALWTALATAGGAAGGAAACAVLRRPWGGPLIGAAVSGWLIAEALTWSPARASELGVALIVGAAAFAPRAARTRPGVAAWSIGVVTGAAAEVAFIAAMRLVLGHLG